MERNRFTAMVVLIGWLLLALGAFLPWVKVYAGLGSVSISGLEIENADARWLLGFGVVSALLTARVFVMKHRFTGADALWTLIMSGLVLYIAVTNIDAVGNSTELETSAGSGLWLTFVAGGVLLFGAVMGLLDASTPSGWTLAERWRYYQSGTLPSKDGITVSESETANG